MKSITAWTLVSLLVAPLVFAAPDEEPKEEHAAHAIQKQGPNQGRLITDLEPHLEFLVTDDRRVQLLFVDDENKPVMRPEASLGVICGDRSNPTRMTFEKSKTGYLSVEKLPEGKNIPTILRVKTDAEASWKTIRFNLNLNDCPTCDFAEYNCTCEHGDDHEGHDHE